ncbi:MAG: hypothetical protein L0I76_36465, partial [Pseudonocardia sp.]|nr:hypothetical protein [Pseudonocardia sp.]
LATPLAGGGVLGMHTAALCFDDWTRWADHPRLRLGVEPLAAPAVDLGVWRERLGDAHPARRRAVRGPSGDRLTVRTRPERANGEPDRGRVPERSVAARKAHSLAGPR